MIKKSCLLLFMVGTDGEQMHIRLISLICYSQMAHIFITVMSSRVLVRAHMGGGEMTALEGC